jgi:hypothetical protein
MKFLSSIKSSVLCLLMVSNFAVSAQNADSLKYHKILMISYYPDYYLSDAERDIMKSTSKSQEEYQRYFRYSLDRKLSGELESVLPTISLLQDTSNDAVKDLYSYYKKANYNYADPIGIKKDKKKAKKGSKEESTEDVNQHTAEQYEKANANQKFMNAQLADSIFLTNLCKKYKADLIVSVNQMEIVTNYNTCIDIANRIYQRDVLIHYTIMNAKGKVLIGNCAKSSFPSNSNLDTEIAERTFPQISKVIATEVGGLRK